MRVGIEDSPAGVADSQRLACRLTISIIRGTGGGSEMSGFVNEGTGLGIGSSSGSIPELAT